MMAIDVPISVMSGLVLAEAGQKLLKTRDKNKIMFMRLVVALFAVLFPFPNALYYLLGWPAWETNFIWKWVGHIYDVPIRALFSHLFLALSVVPAVLALELGRYFIKIKKERWIRISYIATFLLVGLLLFLLRDRTFNVASTYEKFYAGETYSFWTLPFATGWAITTAYFWIGLFGVYRWLSKKE